MRSHVDDEARRFGPRGSARSGRWLGATLGLAAAAVLTAEPSAADDLLSGCPARAGGKPLASVDLFDGPPSEGVALAPEASSPQRNLWTDLNTTGRPVVVVCRYQGVPRPLQGTLAPAMRRCAGLFAKGGKSYSSFACRP